MDNLTSNENISFLEKDSLLKKLLPFFFFFIEIGN